MNASEKTETPRRRLRALFDGARQDTPLVCLHMWGRYPFEHAGNTEPWDNGRAEGMAPVYEAFVRRFPCDWLHVCEGMPREAPCPIRDVPDKQPPLSPKLIDAWVDDNLDGQTYTAEESIRTGMYDHVHGLAERLGEEFMIFPNQGAPGSGFPWLSWDGQMTLVQQRPELVRHYVRRDDNRFLARVAAAGRMGADGYIFSEGYGGACDLISPELFEEVFLEPKRDFYQSVRELGMLGIGYFLGGIEPYLDTIDQMRVDGVMLEESKKGFDLDPVRIRKKLDPRVVLFGNIDSYLLLTGTPQAIREAVRHQAEARAHGPFVHANGSPICPDTPPENIDAFLEAAREEG